MFKIIAYTGHKIKLLVYLNFGMMPINEVNTFTHKIECYVDDNILASKENLVDEALLLAITDMTNLAERRIDLIGTPYDTPIVAELISIGFEFNPEGPVE